MPLQQNYKTKGDNLNEPNHALNYLNWQELPPKKQSTFVIKVDSLFLCHLDFGWYESSAVIEISKILAILLITIWKL